MVELRSAAADRQKGRSVKFLFLESFYGGSHKDFADGLVAHSGHRFDLETLPARFWKWRMRGAALHFVKKIPDPSRYDGLIVTDLISLSDLKSLWGSKCPPALVYFHENQLSYPIPDGESMDYQFGFTDITTALSAERVLFNSYTHRDTFFQSLPSFIRKMPEYRPSWAVEVIERKSDVLYPGCSFRAGYEEPAGEDGQPPLIIWNHRWEFDKDPDSFFNALNAVKERGMEFRLALLGENFQVVPKPFEAARERFGDRIVRYGFVESREEYTDWLRKGHIVISTAIQENFGIAAVEAIRYGCHPLLPRRLSYPELIPREHHDACLYRTREELVDKLCRLLSGKGAYNIETQKHIRKELSASMARFAWEKVIDNYDGELEKLAAGRVLY
jgi:glycosyltransferase involved in cell wall biosynthesis